MKCEDLSEALVDLVDGRLDGAGQRSVERHLEGCENCRALVEDLRSIRAAAFMLDRREPKAETWSKVRAAIAVEPAVGGALLTMPAAVRRSLGGGGCPQRRIRGTPCTGDSAHYRKRRRDRSVAATW